MDTRRRVTNVTNRRTPDRRVIRRKKSRNYGPTLLAFIALVALLWGFNLVVREILASLLPRTSTTETFRPLDDPESFSDAYSLETPTQSTIFSEHALALTPMHTNNTTDTGYLTLINRLHPVSIVPDTNLLISAWPAVPVSAIYGMYLHPSALRAVGEMFDSARESEVGTFFVSSGFRGLVRQGELYNADTSGVYVLPPGHSEHHTGLAADIMIVGMGMSEMVGTEEARWLADNSYRYGLILRYPQGAESITGIGYEPWHFRYVGRVHAYYMWRNNFVLEEYIAYIQSLGSFSFEKDGIIYYILYQAPQNGMIYLPEGVNFTVSSDNLGGYIVTAWR